VRKAHNKKAEEVGHIQDRADALSILLISSELPGELIVASSSGPMPQPGQFSLLAARVLEMSAQPVIGREVSPVQSAPQQK
jgi:hypothetical protein